MSASDSTPAGFNFITVDPSSRTESSSSRTLIRANAGRYIWKRRKAGTKDTGRAKPYERPNTQSPSSLTSPETNEAAVKLEPETPGITLASDEDNSASDSTVVPFKREVSCDTVDLTASLAHGLKTPMLTVFGTEVPEDIVRRTIKYCQSTACILADCNLC